MQTQNSADKRAKTRVITQNHQRKRLTVELIAAIRSEANAYRGKRSTYAHVAEKVGLPESVVARILDNDRRAAERAMRALPVLIIIAVGRAQKLQADCAEEALDEMFAEAA